MKTEAVKKVLKCLEVGNKYRDIWGFGQEKPIKYLPKSGEGSSKAASTEASDLAVKAAVIGINKQH